MASSSIIWPATIKNPQNVNASGYGAGIIFKNNSSNIGQESNKWAGIAGVAGTNWSDRTDLVFYGTSAAGSVSPSERMRITGAGNIGIGTSSPNSRLQSSTSGGNSLQYALELINPDGTNSGGSATGIIFGVESYVNSYRKGGLVYERTGGNGVGDFHFLQNSVGGLNASLSDKVVTIKNNGYVGIATASPTEKLHVVGNILASGTITNSSDRRLKKNIKPIEDALEKLESIVGIKYFWKEPKKHNSGEQIGVIAQDVEKVFPQAVITSPDGFKSVAYVALVAPVIEAIKELNHKFQAVLVRVLNLEQKVDEKNNEIAELKERVMKAEQESYEMKLRLKRLEGLLLTK